jgi:DNA-directed RNA polymerase alpha subunit
MTDSDQKAIKFAPSDEYIEQLAKTKALLEQERQNAEELKRKLYSVIQNISELRGKIRAADAEIGQVLQELFGETSEELLAPIKFDDLPVRAANALRNDRVSTYGDLLDKTEAELLRSPNFGRKSLVKIKEHLRKEVPLPMLIENGWA